MHGLVVARRWAVKGFAVYFLQLLLAGCGGGGSSDSDSGRDGEDETAETAYCNAETGLAEPLPVCSADNICTRPGAEVGTPTITTSYSVPMCRTTVSGRAVFNDGSPLSWTDSSGVIRSACLFTPGGASEASPRPLVVWLHGGNGTADDVYDYTSLREKAVNYNLSGDPSRPGFLLLSVHGRHLQYPTEAPRDGNHHDFYYRDLASPSTNPDIANVDRLIDDLVSTGNVDPTRIYMMGWSNGAFFSQMYAIARQQTPTPAGNRPAAVVAFTGGDPFNNIRADQSPSCQLDPYPVSTVPIFLVSRACDIVACDASQAESLEEQGIVVAPGHIVGEWETVLPDRVANTQVSRLIVSGTGQSVSVCTAAPFCSATIATINHLRWPDGVADGSGIDHEPVMLDFLRQHSL